MGDNASDIHKKLLLARIPAMPEVLLTLLGAFAREDCSAASIAPTIAADAALSAKVLAAANAARFHQRQALSDITHCVLALGLDAVKTVSLGEAVMQVFKDFRQGGALDLRHFWLHALRTALLSRELARRSGLGSPDTAYTAGLLHNIGVLALLSTDPGLYAPLLAAHADDGALQAAEQQHFGLTHPEVSAWLLRRWQLDTHLADCVLYHHEAAPRLQGAQGLVGVIAAASAAALRRGAEDFAQAAALLDCSTEAVLEIDAACSNQLTALATCLGLSIPGPTESARPGCLLAVKPSPPRAALRQQLIEHIADISGAQMSRLSFDSAPTLTRLGELCQAVAPELFGATRCLLLVRHADGALHAQPSPPGESSARVLEAHHTLAAPQRCMQTRSQLSVQASDTATPVVDRQMLDNLGSASAVCAPLCLQERPVGVLVLGFPAEAPSALEGRQRMLQWFCQGLAERIAALGPRGQSSIDALLAQGPTQRTLHELGSPLSIVRNYLAVLEQRQAKGLPLGEELKLIGEEIERAARLLRSLAGQASIDEAQAPVDLVQETHKLLSFCRQSGFVPAHCQLEVQLAAAPCPVRIGRDELKQVLLNLIRNAVEAMPQGGRLTISGGHPLQRDGQLYIELCIGDNGGGIAPALLPQLFSPLTSTKGPGHGGIGLSIVHDILVRAGGQISCRSSPQGTHFELCLLPSAPR